MINHHTGREKPTRSLILLGKLGDHLVRWSSPCSTWHITDYILMNFFYCLAFFLLLSRLIPIERGSKYPDHEFCPRVKYMISRKNLIRGWCKPCYTLVQHLFSWAARVYVRWEIESCFRDHVSRVYICFGPDGTEQATNMTKGPSVSHDFHVVTYPCAAVLSNLRNSRALNTWSVEWISRTWTGHSRWALSMQKNHAPRFAGTSRTCFSNGLHSLFF
jgi:hypothetical protein